MPESEELEIYLIYAPIILLHSNIRVGGVDSLVHIWDPDFKIEPIDEGLEDLVRYYNMDFVEAELGAYQPPANSEIVFGGYFLPDLSEGKDWLPEPGEAIGVSIGYSNPLSEGRLIYHVWDVSTWLGECMNVPVVAEPPPKRGDSTDVHFDFSIPDSIKDRYDIYITNLEIPILWEFNGTDNVNEYIKKFFHESVLIDPE